MTATDLGTIGKDNYYGYGLVNAYAAVNGLSSAPATEGTPVADNTTPETDPEPQVTPATPTAIAMSVGGLTAVKESSVKGKNTFGWVVATVKVTDQNGKPVPATTVSGSWSGLTIASVSGVTDAEGVVNFTSPQVKNPAGTFTFKITDATCSGYVYDPLQNVCSTLSVSF
jgi:subtilisin